MSKINDAFKNGNALITFLTCGDPDLETTEKLIMGIEEAGADIIQLGIPFSDPTAEGPVIQAASERALSGGTTTDKVFDMIARVRDKVNVPLVILTYANVVFSYGIDRFCERAAQLGVDGLVLHDIPYEEMDEFAPACKANGLTLISFAAPTSGTRLPIIAKAAEGYIYCISCKGTIGVEKIEALEMLKTIHECTDTPAVVGSRINTPELAADLAQYAEGIIIDEPVMEIIGKYGKDSVPHVKEFVKIMKDAIK